MGKEYSYDKQCKHCGKELTTETTSRNFINDQNFICYDCVSARMSSGGYRIRNLEQVYDPNRNKVHNEIHKKAQQHTNQVEIKEEEFLLLPKIKELKYPTPRGKPIIVKHHKVVCRKCDTVLTTTNAHPERVRNKSMYICAKCEYTQEKIRDTDPLYKEKREIEKILNKLYGPPNKPGRKLKQFTWEYVEIRFAKVQEPPIPKIDQEQYDKTVKLFGEEYATKRYRPRTANALQTSFGHLSSGDGCRKLLVLFEYELYKLRNANGKKRKRAEAKQYLKLFDADYNNRRSDKNTGFGTEDYNTYDKFSEEAYMNSNYKPKIWDPYSPEAS